MPSRGHPLRHPRLFRAVLGTFCARYFSCSAPLSSIRFPDIHNFSTRKSLLSIPFIYILIFICSISENFSKPRFSVKTIIELTVDNQRFKWYNNLTNLPVAQLDSASDSDSEGRRFESYRVGQKKRQASTEVCRFFNEARLRRMKNEAGLRPMKRAFGSRIGYTRFASYLRSKYFIRA